MFVKRTASFTVGILALTALLSAATPSNAAIRQAYLINRPTGSYYYPIYVPIYAGAGNGYNANYNAYYNGPAGASQANVPSNNTVILDMRVPDPNAQVWIEGQPTQQRGTFREFESPPLAPGMNYTYHIRADWTQDGRKVEQTRNVPVQTGTRLEVDFAVQAGSR